jgi:hypothetical protein
MLDKILNLWSASGGMGQLIALICAAGIGIAFATAIAWRHMHENNTPANDLPPPSARPAARSPSESATASPDISLPTLVAIPTPLTDDDLDWIALAADELRTPLTVLRGYAEYLRQHVEFASRTSLASVSERLVHQVERLEGLIEAWMVTAQMSGEQRIPTARPTDLMALARALCARLTALDEPPCDIGEGSPLWALVDQSLIEHALAVIIRSARRAAQGGLIEVVVRTVGRGAQLRISLAVGDRRSQQRGQSPDLWEALELDLARVLCEEHGGWVELADRAGGGAITTLWLPGHIYIPLTPARPAPQIPLRQSA